MFKKKKKKKANKEEKSNPEKTEHGLGRNETGQSKSTGRSSSDKAYTATVKREQPPRKNAECI